MPHFLIKKEEIKDSFIELFDNENLFHITKVLRYKKGEKIKFIDTDKNVYYCTILKIEKNYLLAEINDCKKSNRFLKTNICLIQSVLASDAQNLAIANALQCGVREIYPVISQNSTLSKKSLKDKKEKWEKIALENFKQCERADMALIYEVSDLKDCLKKFKKENVIIFAEKYANKKLDPVIKNMDKSEKIALVIGPEGGFSEEEFEYFKNNNYNLVSLGKMIYKAPNAITAGVSNVVSRVEDDI